jgi:cobalt-zinc-cadmium efflux system outer membrane protein
MKRWLLATLAVALAGCQPYRAKPLDWPGHEAEWSARSPASPEVRAYAHQLMAADPVDDRTVKFDVADGLTIGEARAVALLFNPALRAARLRARVPAVGAAEAGRWADPALQVNAERILQGLADPWVLGGVLNLTVPISGRLPLERAEASAEADVARITAQLEELRVLAELDTAWTALRLADERIDVGRRFLSDLEALATQAERLRAAGELGPVEAGLFQVEAIRRRADLQFEQSVRAERVLAIKALMGLKPDASVELVTAWPTALRPSEFVPDGDLIERHPAIALERSRHALAERTLQLEMRRQYADWNIGGGYGIEEDTRRLLGGFSIPLPMFNGNARGIAEARAQRDVAEAAAYASREQLVSDIARARVLMDAAVARRHTLERSLAPAADAQLRAARELGKLGQASAVAVFEALVRSQEARLALLDAVADEATARNRLNAVSRPAVMPWPVKEPLP